MSQRRAHRPIACVLGFHRWSQYGTALFCRRCPALHNIDGGAHRSTSRGSS